MNYKELEMGLWIGGRDLRQWNEHGFGGEGSNVCMNEWV
jgi:hypothetical protein